MLQIYVEGKRVALPEDTSFEYVAENRLFSNADGYSFDIEIPVKGVPENQEIFGFVWLPETDIDKVRFRAQLLSPQINLQGSLNVVSISETSISLQFLEGRSEQNSEEDFEEIYINELNLGYQPVSTAGVSPSTKWGSFDSGAEAVALRWVISDSGETIHNDVIRNTSTGAWAWNRINRISYMPYLITIIKAICKELGYECNIAPLEGSEYRHLLICNTVPASLKLSDYSYALPHWTVNEFFENLEPVLDGEFDIDHVGKSISFNFVKDNIGSAGEVVIDNIVDEFGMEIENPDSSEDEVPELLQNIGYTDNSCRFWPIDCCDWFIRQRLSETYVDDGSGSETRSDYGSIGRQPSGPSPGWAVTTQPDWEQNYKRIVKLETMKDIIEVWNDNIYSYAEPYSDVDKLYYVKEVESYFMFRVAGVCRWNPALPNSSDIPREEAERLNLKPLEWYYRMQLMPVNNFGDFVKIDKDDADRKDLKVLPVAIDEATGSCIFLPFSESDANDYEYVKPDGDDVSTISQTQLYNTIINGKSTRPEFYSNLYVGFWKGYEEWMWKTKYGLIPSTSNVFVWSDRQYRIIDGPNLRLNLKKDRAVMKYQTIEAKKLYKFSFMSDTIPSPRATFYIKGKRYICSKITASFSIDGMSQLLKGEFYRY